MVYTPSDFYCINCGHKNFNIYRKNGQERKGGHLKVLYCPYCKKEFNNVEVKENDETYTYDDFRLEHECGNFDSLGNRRMNIKAFKLLMEKSNILKEE